MYRRRAFRRTGYGSKRTSFRKRPFRRNSNYKRFRKSKFRRTRVKIPGIVFPDYTLVKMNVRDTIDIGFGTIPSMAGEYSFINAFLTPMYLNNPLSTFSTDTPAGLLTWDSVYGAYIVHKSSIKVTPLSFTIQNQTDASVTIPSDNPSLPYQVTLVPVTINTLTSAFVPFDEQPYARRKMFNAVNTGTAYTNTNPPTVALLNENIQNNITTPITVVASPLTNYAMFNAQSGDNIRSGVVNSMMTKKMLGYKDLSDVRDVRGITLSGGGPTAPGDQWYWMIEIKSLIPWDGVNPVAHFTLGQCNLRAEMFFKCQFLDRNIVPDNSL